MSVNYTAWLFDDFDWVYKNFHKSDVLQKVRSVIPCATEVANFPHWLILDTGHQHPSVLIGRVMADKIFVTNDIGDNIPKELPKEV